MKLIIVRHGETHENVAGIMLGHGHGKLTDLGIEQAKKVGLRLKDEKIDIAYVSDLERTCATASHILSFHPTIPVIYTKDLRERNFGIYEGMKSVVVKDLLKHIQKKWEHKPESGESRIELQQRIVSFCEDLFKRHKGQTILIVSHGGPMTCLYLHLFEKSFEEYAQYHPENTAVTILEISDDKKHTVHVLNCVKHLE